MAATLNTHTCEIVKRAFQDNHKGSVKLSDSQVTLYWINNEKKTTEAVGEKQGSGNKQIYPRLDVETYTHGCLHKCLQII